ncbi:MAG: sulfite exporter TauE/SafE family protein, partial [Candidatus Paceibacterota bacterium]
MNNSQSRKVKIKVHGMHCASCEVLIERKLRKVIGIEKVHVNHANGEAVLICSCEPNIYQLNNLVKEDGYQITSWNSRETSSLEVVNKNTIVDYVQMGWIFLVIVALYYIFKQFNFLPSFSISGHMSYGLVFLIGLFAAVSSCIAVVGGLLLALAGKYNELHPNITGIQKFKPHIYFNMGRVIGYTVFGALVGAVGSVMTLSSRTNGYLMVFVSV